METRIAVLSPTRRRKAKHLGIFPLPIKSAVLYVLFLMLGIAIYRFLPVRLSPHSCTLLCNFLQITRPSGISFADVFHNLAVYIRPEIILLSLSFLFTYSYFCVFLHSLLLCYRSFVLGLAFGAAEELFRAGDLPFANFTVFICVQAMFSALLIGYTSLSVSLSSHLRNLGRRQILSAFLRTVEHFVRLILFIATLLVLYFLTYLIFA